MRFQNFDQEHEFNNETNSSEYANEYSNEWANEWNAESIHAENVFAANELQHQSHEMELAAELLGVTNEAELEQFLGGFLSRAASAAGSFINSPAGQQIKGLLKSAAKQALPKIGGAIGGHFGGEGGAQLGSKIAAGAGRLLGLELEGLSNEDREFEVARQFVRFANNAVSRTARHGATALDARNAFRNAAREHAPGLFSAPVASNLDTNQAINPNNLIAGFPRSGRWVRNGNTLTLV
jgi:hypothetical protein